VEKTQQQQDENSPAERSPEILCSELVADMKTLQLATLDDDGLPHCSYAPFVRLAPNNFYIFISELAAHTRYLQVRPAAAFMIIADESDSAQIFARTRVYYQCNTSLVAPDTDGEDYQRSLDAFAARQGDTVALLRTLGDFRLFRLTPHSGHFVMGFGQAYRFSGPDLAVFTHSRTL